MYNQLKWSPLDERRQRAHLTTFFKFHRGEVVMNNTRKPVPSPPTRQHAPLTKRPICLLPVCRTQYRQKFFPPSVSVQSATMEAFKNLIYPPSPILPPPPRYPTSSPSLIPPPHPPSDCHTVLLSPRTPGARNYTQNPL